MCSCSCNSVELNSTLAILFNSINMLFVIYLCALLSTGISANIDKVRIKFPPEKVALLRAVFLKCGEEYGIPLSTIVLIKEGYYSEDETFKKYIYCVYQEGGYGKPNGHINIAETVTLFPKDINILPILEICDGLQGNNPVETAFLTFKCYQESTASLAI